MLTIVRFSAPDQPGIIARLSDLIATHNGNIIECDQSTVLNQEAPYFFTRILVETSERSIINWNDALNPLTFDYNGILEVRDRKNKLKCPILCSKDSHCLNELLHQWSEGLLPIDIPCVISNDSRHERLVSYFDIPFFYIDSSSKDRKEAEILEKIKDSDLSVLARYMQILSEEFITKYNRPIINIHHSFLPAFKGAKPYHQAFDRGVKMIGATTHYVTEDLDEGPIIEQSVVSISHRESVDDLKRKGRLLEQSTLVNTIRLLAEGRVFRCGSKTVVF